MSLETATFINGLVATNPLGSDPISSGDDHIRLIKATVLATFPNITGAVTKTHTQLNNALDKTGDTMTGALVLSGDPTLALHPTTKQYVDSADAALMVAIKALYPVGSVYMNATDSTNPATLFGFGTWTAFGAGKVPVGYDSTDTLFNAGEKTGGSKDAIVVSHTHTATVSDPGHSHSIQGTSNQGGTSLPLSGGSYNVTYNSNTSTTGITVSNASTGSSGTNANLQPYITVYMWKRTA